jgi:hypothetical protein
MTALSTWLGRCDPGVPGCVSLTIVRAKVIIGFVRGWGIVTVAQELPKGTVTVPFRDVEGSTRGMELKELSARTRCSEWRGGDPR